MDIVPKIFGIDIDDTISKTTEMLLLMTKERYGIEVEWESLNNYYLDKSEDFPLGEKQFREILDGFHASLNSKAGLIEKAGESLAILRRYHRVYLVTARPESMRQHTELWLKRHKICYDELIFLSKKHILKDKVDFWVEDSGEQAKNLAVRGDKVFLLNYPWNQGVKKHPNILRVKNWEEIMDLLLYFSVVKIK